MTRIPRPDIEVPAVVAELTERFGEPRVQPGEHPKLCPITTGPHEGRYAWKLAWAWFPAMGGGFVSHYFSIEVTADGKHWLVRAGHHSRPGRRQEDACPSFSHRPSEDTIRATAVAGGILPGYRP
jgi:hypothetical protein